MHIECFMVEKQDEAQMNEDNKVLIQNRTKKKAKQAAKNRIMFGEEINLNEGNQQQAKQMKNFAKIDEIQLDLENEREKVGSRQKSRGGGETKRNRVVDIRPSTGNRSKQPQDNNIVNLNVIDIEKNGDRSIEMSQDSMIRKSDNSPTKKAINFHQESNDSDDDDFGKAVGNVKFDHIDSQT